MHGVTWFIPAVCFLMMLLLFGCAQESKTSFEIGAGGKAVVEAPPGTYRIRIANHGPGEVQVAAKDRRLLVQSQATLEPNTLRPFPVFPQGMGRYELLNLSGSPARIRVHLEGREPLPARVDVAGPDPVAAGQVE